jgi:Periplasmic binding protein-like domain
MHGRAMTTTPASVDPKSTKSIVCWRMMTRASGSCCSDVGLMRIRGAMKSAHAACGLGRTVPSGLSVIGWDDLTIAAYTVPGLTTLRMPTREIVAEGVRIAVELARDATASREPRVKLYEPTLIIRESTAPPGELAEPPSRLQTPASSRER